MKETKFTVVECIAEDNNVYAASVLRRGQFSTLKKKETKRDCFIAKNQVIAKDNQP